MRLGEVMQEARAAFVEQVVGWTRMMDPNAFPDFPSYWRNIPVPLSNWQLDFPRAAAAVAIVYACVDMLAGDAAPLPVKFYRVGKGGKKTLIDPEPDNAPGIWEKANPTQSSFELKTEIQTSLDIGGNAYLFLENYGQEKPSKDWELWYMPPHLVKPTVTDRREPVGYEFMGGVAPVILPAEKVIHFRYWHPSFFPLGLSPLEAARIQYETRYLSGKTNRAFYANGGVANGVFTTPQGVNLTPAEKKANQSAIMKLTSGPENSFKPWFLEGGMKFERRGLTHQEMAFIETQELTDADICRVYGIPPVILGIKKGGGMSDAGATTDLLRYWEFAQKKRAALRDAVVTKHFCIRFGDDIVCETDFSNVPALQEQLLKQTKALVIATGRPIMTPNEGRLPIPWLNPIEGDPTADELFKPSTVDIGKPIGGTGVEDTGSAADEQDPEAEPKTDPKPKAGRGRRATRAHQRKRASATLARHERRFAAAVRTFFTNQQERVKAKVEHAYQSAGFDTMRMAWRANGHSHKRDVHLDWSTILGQDDEVDIEALRRIFQSLIVERGEEQLAEIGVEVEVELNKGAASRYADRYAAALVGQINDTTRGRLNDALEAVAAAGGTYTEALDAVREVFDYRRDNAATIARTEMLGAYNFAGLDAARQSGVVTGKSWLTTEDELVRDAHAAAESDGVIGIDESWTLEGNDGPVEMAFPGDPDGPPELVCNCRCTMNYETNDERVRELKDAYRRTRQRRKASALAEMDLDQVVEALCRN